MRLAAYCKYLKIYIFVRKIMRYNKSFFFFKVRNVINYSNKIKSHVDKKII